MRSATSDRRYRPEDRADVGDQLHHAVEHRERHRVLLPVGEDPEHAEDVQRQARRGAHHEAEQQLPTHVAGDSVLGQRGVVVGGRAVAVGHRPAHEPPDALAVEQHVDGEHEDQHQVEDRARRFGEQPAAEGGDRAGALGDFVLDRLQRRFALLDEVHVDAVPVERALEACRAFCSLRRPSVGRLWLKDCTWWTIGLASRKPIPANVRKNARYTASTARPRGRRERWRKATAGLRISAMRAATTKITSTFPAARASAHSASSASGSTTSCTQRGTTTRGGVARCDCAGAPRPSARAPRLRAGPPRALRPSTLTCLPSWGQYG